jgi:hypothetical protein
MLIIIGIIKAPPDICSTSYLLIGNPTINVLLSEGHLLTKGVTTSDNMVWRHYKTGL